MLIPNVYRWFAKMKAYCFPGADEMPEKQVMSMTWSGCGGRIRTCDLQVMSLLG